MRRISMLFLAAGLLSVVAPTVAPTLAHAQRGRGGADRGGGGGGDSGGDDQRKSRLDREMQTLALPLPPVLADGPCPFVKVLYDAARTVEFKDARQAASNVTWSGEIEGLLSDCEYKDDAPIKVSANVTFRLGKGPQADAARKSYSYWVAVTDRNRAVLAKEYFTVDAAYAPGSDRTVVIDRVQQIMIPRKAKTVSGENFEVLIGFDLTPQQVEFNRSGARFRVNAGSETAAAAPPPATAPAK